VEGVEGGATVVGGARAKKVQFSERNWRNAKFESREIQKWPRNTEFRGGKYNWRRPAAPGPSGLGDLGPERAKAAGGSDNNIEAGIQRSGLSERVSHFPYFWLVFAPPSPAALSAISAETIFVTPSGGPRQGSSTSPDSIERRI
jgi:hypothetical protein